VSFAVFRSKGASEVSVAEVVTETLDEIRAKHPDVELVPVDDTVFFTYGNYESALHTLVEGSLLAVLVGFWEASAGWQKASLVGFVQTEAPFPLARAISSVKGARSGSSRAVTEQSSPTVQQWVRGI